LVTSPSSGGTMPEKWFASRLLFEKGEKPKLKNEILILLRKLNRKKKK